MSVNFDSLLVGRKGNVVTEALYFCVRALKQANLSTFARKDYYQDTTTHADSLEAKSLAAEILKKIAESEGVELGQMDKKRVYSYIHMMSDLSNTARHQDSSLDLDLTKASKILEQMRQTDV